MEQALRDLDPPLETAGQRLHDVAGAVCDLETFHLLIDTISQHTAERPYSRP